MNLSKKYDFYKNSIFYLIASAVVCVAAITVISVCGFNHFTSVASGYVLLQSVLVLLISLVFVLLYVGLRFNFGKALSIVLITAHNALLSTALIAIIRVPVTESIVAGYMLLVALTTIFTLILTENTKDVNLKKANYNEIVKNALSSNIKKIVVASAVVIVLSLLCLISLNTNVFSFVRLLLVMIFVVIYSTITVAMPIWCYISSKVKNVKKAKVDVNVENQKVVKAAVIDGDEAGSVAISENKDE
ncbi:MAG TPA: hypothetical protein DCO89_03295 [Clostridiales bacterium]|nr:hypothetical protein [Clostridiales bacterium]